jgi:hypothetical protein
MHIINYVTARKHALAGKRGTEGFYITNRCATPKSPRVYKKYMSANSQKILISLPRNLINAVDLVKHERQISRSAFIRESVLRNLRYYEKYERTPVCFPHDDPKFDSLSNAMVSVEQKSLTV